MTPSDRELMLRVRGGDAEAFATLVSRHQKPLINFFYRRVYWDRSAAEDLAQDVLMRLWNARERYRPDAKFTSYLYRVAGNLVIDRARHRRAAPPPVSIDAAHGANAELRLIEGLAAEAVEPGEQAARREWVERIKGALSGLSEEHREVFVLAHLQGMPYPQISEVLDIPVGTVKSRMHAAVRKLRGALRSLFDDVA
jgi:RNA polymerase sigma-70 factor (ECF subfamily)